MTSVLRLGVYRERIEKYGGRRSAEPRQPIEPQPPQPPQPPVGPHQFQQNGDNGVSLLQQPVTTNTLCNKYSRKIRFFAFSNFKLEF